MGRLRTWLVLVLVPATMATAGCSALNGGLQNAPLPGGADVGDDPYTVRAEFTDVLELVPQSLVKVNDVAVGTVTDISLARDSWNAVVTMELNRDAELPANAIARIRQTSLLGEKFVDLAVPEAEPPAGTLADGASIPLERTSRATEVEEVLGALSLLLNGGGVEQVRTIATELNTALAGNEPEVRALLGDLDELVGTLDASKGDINRALDGLNRLSGTLAAQRGQIAGALDGLAPGLQVLADQRVQLTGMLTSLDRLSGVAVDTVNRSRDDVLADLALLRPTLTELERAGSDLPNSLQLIATFPFTDGTAREALRGDYANLFIDVDFSLGTILENLSQSNQPLQGVPPPIGDVLNPGQPPLGPPLEGLSELVPPPNPAGQQPVGLGALLEPILGGGNVP